MKNRLRQLGGGIAVREHEDGSETTEMLTPAVEGKPISGELVHLSECDQDGWQSVTTLYKSGPARVNSRKYCDGYERIFGKKRVGEA